MMNTKKMTIDQAIALASDKLASNIAQLTAEGEAAVGVFKSTEARLNTVNEKLKANVDQLAELEAMVHGRKLNTIDLIEHNDAVIRKIRSILED